MSQGQNPTTARLETDMAKEEPNAVPTAEDFLITKLFLCTWHGNMSSNPARLVDVTSAISKPNDHTPGELITLAQKATADLLSNGNACESYRASKSKMSTFTVTTPDSSTPLATFRVPLKCWANVPITFSPSPNTPDAQSTLSLNRTNWGQLLTGCNHAFVRNSETFEWVFVSGTEIALRDKHSRTLVKFYHAPSWFQSGGVLAIGEDWQGKGTENHEQKQQQREWEQVVVVTLFAFLRKEREWRYAMAGLVFPIKRGALAKKKTTI